VCGLLYFVMGRDGRDDVDISVLPREVEKAVQKLYDDGRLKGRDIPQPVWKTLAEFDSKAALGIMDSFARKDMSTIYNKSSFLIGMMKRVREEQGPKVELKPGWATLNDVTKIRCNRDTLSRWLDEDEFGPLVKGCVVRVLVGEQNRARTYRMCVVGGLETGRETYRFGKVRTNKLLICKFGDLVRPFKMEYISNSDITEEEFNNWHVQMEKCNLSVLTRNDVDKKLRKFRDFAREKEGSHKRRRSRSSSHSHSSTSSSSSSSSSSRSRSRSRDRRKRRRSR